MCKKFEARNGLCKVDRGRKLKRIKHLSMLMILILFSNSMYAQLKKVSGTIKDAKGETLIGVSVKLKGTNIGVLSDAKGRYSLSVEGQNAVLVFSYLGYIAKEVVVGDREEVNVMMSEDTKALGEVVVVGYGTQKKETLTGAIATIGGEEITTTKSTSVVSGIQGKIPGVLIRQQSGEPGTFNSLVSIRGFGTPLLVIDGIPRDGMSDFERLNPEDIESISVLKDASAAIYGMNSDNGVIIVTTKKGVKGKTQFNFTSFYGAKRATSMPENVDAYTYRVIRNEMQANTKLPPTFSQTELDKWRQGDQIGYQDYDWFGETLRDFASQSQNNLSVSGGSDKVNYYSSLGILADNGILASDIQKYRKYNFRNNISMQLTKDLLANLSFAGKIDNNKGPQGSYFWFFKPLIIADRGIPPFVPGTDDHISLIPPEFTNPYALSNESISGYEKFSNVQYQTNLELSYSVPFVPNLKLGVIGAYDSNNYNYSNLRRSYYQYDVVTDAPTLRGANEYTNNVDQFSRTYLQASANYKKTFLKDHNLGATLVYEQRSLRNDLISAKRQYDNVYTHDIINQGSLTNLQNGGDRIIQRYQSVLGRLNYDYKSKYLLEVAFRNDGSYRYAPEKRWAMFPSASIGWRISEESFVRDNMPLITNLKLRASYGKMGADAGNAFEYYPGYRFGAIDGGSVFNPNVLTLGMVPPGVVNNNLTWINTNTTNIGVDLELWQGKLGIVADVFQKNRNGLLANRIQAIPNTFGAAFPQENINSDKVRGIEMLITHRGNIGTFKYDVSANATYARKYLGYTERAPYQSTMQKWKDPWGSDRITGREWGYIYDGQYTNLTQYQNAPLLGGTSGNSLMLPGSNRITDVNGDGIIDGNDQLPAFWSGQYQGFAGNPPIQFGATINMSYKSFDMNVLFQGAGMFTIFSSPNDVWGYGRYPGLWAKYLDRWRVSDPSMNPYDPSSTWIAGEYPALRSNFTGTTDALTTDRWRINATYLRLKSLELGYTFSGKKFQSVGVQNLRLFVNGFNLYTFANPLAKNLDPEREEGAYTADLTYPLMQIYNFGLSLKF